MAIKNIYKQNGQFDWKLVISSIWRELPFCIDRNKWVNLALKGCCVFSTIYFTARIDSIMGSDPDITIKALIKSFSKQEFLFLTGSIIFAIVLWLAKNKTLNEFRENQADLFKEKQKNRQLKLENAKCEQELIKNKKKYREFVSEVVLKDVFEKLNLRTDERITAYVVQKSGLDGYFHPIGRYGEPDLMTQMDKDFYDLYTEGRSEKPYGCIGKAIHNGVDKWVLAQSLPNDDKSQWEEIQERDWNIPKEKAQNISFKAGSIMAVCVGGRNGKEKLALALESKKPNRFSDSASREIKKAYREQQCSKQLKKVLDAHNRYESELIIIDDIAGKGVY